MYREERYNFFGKIALLLLLPLLFILVIPVEHAGSASLYGLTDSWVFTYRLMKLSFPGTISLLFMLFAWASSLMTPREYRNRNAYKSIPVAIAFMVVFGYMATIQAATRLDLQNLGIIYWRYIVEALFVFFGMNFLINTRRKFFSLIEILSLLVFCAMLYGLYNYFFQGGIGAYAQGKVVFWENAKLKVLIFLVAILGGTFLLNEKQGKEALRFPRWFHLCNIALCVLTIVLSARRNSLIGTIILFCMILTWGFFHGKVGRTLFITAGGLMVILVVAAFSYNTIQKKILARISTLSALYTGQVEEGDSLGGHLNDMRLGIIQVKKHPFWGVGYGRSGIGFQKREMGRQLRNAPTITWVHNGFLTIWIQFGIVGVLVYIFLFLKIFITHWRGYRHLKDNIVVFFLFYFVVMFLLELFFPPFSTHFKGSVALFGPLGLSNAYMQIRKREQQNS